MMNNSNSLKPNFTLYHLLYFIGITIIITTDAGFIAPLIPKMMSVFNITLIEVSIFLALMTLIPAFLIPMFGILADKFKRVLIAFIIVVCGAFTSVIMVLIIIFTQNFALFATLGIIAAIINIALGPALFSLLVDYVPAKQRAGIIGWLGIAGTAAIGLGFIVSGIIPSIIFGPNFPLWFPYAFDAIAGFIFAVLTLFLKEPPRGIQEEGLQELFAKGEMYEYSLTFDGAKDFFKSPMNRRIILFQFFVRIRHGILGTYFITFLILTHNFNEFTATLVMFGIFGIQLVGQIYWGNKGDEAYQVQKDGHLNIMIKTLTISLFFSTWVFLIPFSFQTGIGVILFIIFALVLAIGSFFEVGSLPSTGAVISAVNPPEIQGTANSINFLIVTIGRSIMVLLFAVVAVALLNENYAVAFFLFMLFNIPALFVLLSMRDIIIPTIEMVQEDLKARTTKQKIE